MKNFLTVTTDEFGNFSFSTDFNFPIEESEKAYKVNRKDIGYQELAKSLTDCDSNVFSAIDVLTSARKDAKYDYGFLHPELEDKLKEWRLNKAKEAKVPAYMIMGQQTLYNIADVAPINEKELKEIPGFGHTMFERYGAELLDIIGRYLQPFIE